MKMPTPTARYADANVRSHRRRQGEAAAHDPRRGWLMEILRADESEFFSKFGQAYRLRPVSGCVKAWHYHRSRSTTSRVWSG